MLPQQVDKPGAFMQAKMDEIVHIKLEGQMADFWKGSNFNINANTFRVTAEESHVELKKALHTLKAVLWFVLAETFHRTEVFLANKQGNNSQCTILEWHADDLRISNIDPNIVTDIINLLSDEFSTEAPLTVYRGKVHDYYLGMNIDYSHQGKLPSCMALCKGDTSQPTFQY
jgi:hypothetical protein